MVSLFLFLFSFLDENFFSSVQPWVWITELKLTLPFGICFFMGLLCRGVLLIAFILQEKVCNHKLCGTFCHFNMSLCLSKLERKDSMGIVLLSVIVSQIQWGAA